MHFLLMPTAVTPMKSLHRISIHHVIFLTSPVALTFIDGLFIISGLTLECPCVPVSLLLSH